MDKGGYYGKEKLNDNEIITEVEAGSNSYLMKTGLNLLVEDGEVENVSN